jgi:glycosyltransferase involved in cell wall biosynthesis
MATETVSVIVSTYGYDEWEARGTLTYRETIRTLKPAAFDISKVHITYGTLAEARNFGASRATGDWLVFLDADDSLHPSYIHGVLSGWGDLRQPKTTYASIDGSYKTAPTFINTYPSLLDGNWMVIGTAIRRKLFLEVGGFRELPAWEDWDLWLRAWRAGAKIGKAPRAIYNIGPVTDNGRNQQTIGNNKLFMEIRDYHA